MAGFCQLAGLSSRLFFALYSIGVTRWALTVQATITNKQGGVMPTMLTEEDITKAQARAVWHAGQGHRVRAFFARIWTTQIGDLCQGRVWPNVR